MSIKNCNCGGEAKLFIRTLSIDGEEVYYSIYCKKCRISTPASKSMREVMEIWNNVMQEKIHFVPTTTEHNVTSAHPYFIGETW